MNVWWGRIWDPLAGPGAFPGTSLKLTISSEMDLGCAALRK